MPSTLEAIVLGVLVLLLLMWWLPGVRSAMARSRQAEKHWGAALWPIVAVVVFVIGLVALT